jgi:hypothetical protein
MHQSIGEIARQLTFLFGSAVPGTVNLAAAKKQMPPQPSLRVSADTSYAVPFS